MTSSLLGQQLSKTFDPALISKPTRSLQIETCGEFWKGITKPKIRLMGRWLEDAGFKPGSRVQVFCLARGIIELRSPDAFNGRETKRAESEQLNLSF